MKKPIAAKATATATVTLMALIALDAAVLSLVGVSLIRCSCTRATLSGHRWTMAMQPWCGTVMRVLSKISNYNTGGLWNN